MTQLTEEEVELQKKYAILRKHKKILSDLKKQRKESMKSNSADGTNKVGMEIDCLTIEPSLKWNTSRPTRHVTHAFHLGIKHK